MGVVGEPPPRTTHTGESERESCTQQRSSRKIPESRAGWKKQCCVCFMFSSFVVVHLDGVNPEKKAYKCADPVE